MKNENVTLKKKDLDWIFNILNIVVRARQNAAAGQICGEP